MYLEINNLNHAFVIFIATPSGRFLSMYSKYVSAVEPVKLKRSRYL